MDKERKTYSIVRVAFTRIYTSLRHEIEREEYDVDELKAMFALLKEKTSKLEDLNNKIFQLMQDSDEIQEDAMTKEIGRE